MMKKKEYIQPQILVVSIASESPLLSASDTTMTIDNDTELGNDLSVGAKNNKFDFDIWE